VIEKHLLGKETIGVYPLLSDETCWFLAVVSVEKVPQLMLVGLQGSGYKQARVLDAAVHD
jgi:hypothetical protein